MSHRRRLVLLAVVLAQLALPLSLAGLAAGDLAFGQEIRLRAQPVDPVDVFRGNYVVLSYEISQLETDFRVDRGQTICARLHEENGSWTAVFALPERPSGETAICGRARRDAELGGTVAVEYGIETYYASAERAREIENAIGRVPVFVVVDLDGDGSARIERLEFEGSG